MNNLKLIIVLPIVVVLMVVDLVRVVRGKMTVGEEWHNIHMDGNMNHGQGRKEQ